MESAHNTLPIIDHETSLKLAGNNQELANDLLALLIKNLPADLEAIQSALANKDILELRNQLHKLRGGVAYCGLPRIKNILTALETRVKTEPLENTNELLTQLNTEITLLILHYAQKKSG